MTVSAQAAGEPRRSVVILVSPDGNRLLRVRPERRRGSGGASQAPAAAAAAASSPSPAAAATAAAAGGQDEWELPGAKLKAGETALQAAARGLRKATGLCLASLERVGEAYADGALAQAFVYRAAADTPDAVAGMGVAELGWAKRGRRAKRGAGPQLKASLRVLSDLLPKPARDATSTRGGEGTAAAAASAPTAAAASAGLTVGHHEGDAGDYPFPVEDADHCETPGAAYAVSSSLHYCDFH